MQPPKRDVAAHRVKIPVQYMHYVVRRQLLGKRGEFADVGEQNRQCTFLAGSGRSRIPPALIDQGNVVIVENEATHCYGFIRRSLARETQLWRKAESVSQRLLGSRSRRAIFDAIHHFHPARGAARVSAAGVCVRDTAAQ
jgi:hypothetical protein